MEKTLENKPSEEMIQSVMSLAEELLKIHKRMVAEGKVKVVDGKIVFLK